MDQSIGFCTSRDGTRIAYAMAGSGPPVVRPGTWMTHVELDQDSPVWGHLWRELARRNRFVRYDQRRCGLSEREPADFSLEARVQDLEAVVDHLGLERFALFGHSHGAFTAIEYAWRHPERVDRIVLLGAAAQQWMAREVNDANVTLMRTGWQGEPSAVRMMSAYRLVPAAPHAFIESVADLLGKSMTGHSAAELAMESRNIDVVERLQRIEAPTLVLHADSAEVATELGRTIASLMPNARFVPLPSANHILLESEPAWQTFRSAVGEFLAASEEALGPEEPALNGSTPELTAREAEVLALVAQGRSDKEIAHDLSLSARTVSHHVKSILRKTDSMNRAQAAVWAAHRGLA